MECNLTYRLVWKRFRSDLASSWRFERVQDRGQNLKKSMLKNNTFLASISEEFGRRFGRVFGRFFEPKTHAKSDLKQSVRQAKSIGKTNTKSMSARLQQSIFRAKIYEKSHVFWDIDFEGIFDGFHVLRTDRRTRGRKERSQAHADQCVLQPLMHVRLQIP